VPASGDETEGRFIDPRVGGLRVSDDGAWITSALTTPRTCLNAPWVGVTIMGASFKKSLEKLAPDMNEFLVTPEMPEIWDGA
jgi:hypothetical protein